MKKLIISGLAVFLTISVLTACTNKEMGTTGGAIVGGVAGSALTGGSTAGTIAGAVGGGFVGNQLSH
jgi:osmotically inducible lipoprotein OsmB